MVPEEMECFRNLYFLSEKVAWPYCGFTRLVFSKLNRLCKVHFWHHCHIMHGYSKQNRGSRGCEPVTNREEEEVEDEEEEPKPSDSAI